VGSWGPAILGHAEPNILNPYVFLMFHRGLTIVRCFGVSPDEMASSRFRARAS
jgi:hypothetical protein